MGSPTSFALYLSSCSRLVALVSAVRQQPDDAKERELAMRLHEAAHQHLEPVFLHDRTYTLGDHARDQLGRLSAIAVRPDIEID